MCARTRDCLDEQFKIGNDSSIARGGGGWSWYGTSIFIFLESPFFVFACFPPGQLSVELWNGLATHPLAHSTSRGKHVLFDSIASVVVVVVVEVIIIPVFVLVLFVCFSSSIVFFKFKRPHSKPKPKKRETPKRSHEGNQKVWKSRTEEHKTSMAVPRLGTVIICSHSFSRQFGGETCKGLCKFCVSCQARPDFEL